MTSDKAAQILYKTPWLLRLSLLIVAILLTGCLRYALAILKSTPAIIVDYAPQEFAEKAENPFFYSIGNKLYFNDHIEENGKVLFNAHMLEVMPSPNSKWALRGGAEKLNSRISERPATFE